MHRASRAAGDGPARPAARRRSSVQAATPITNANHPSVANTSSWQPQATSPAAAAQRREPPRSSAAAAKNITSATLDGCQP